MNWNNEDMVEAYKEGYEKAMIEVVNAHPNINRTGEWLITDGYPHNVYCSVCYKTYAQTHWAVWTDEDRPLPRNFCPYCGAKMMSEESEEQDG